MVSADAGLARYVGRINLLSAQARRAMVEGLNEGGDLERTKVRRDLKEQTGALRYGAIVKRTGARRASAGDLEYRIFGSGKGMPIKEFPVRAAAGAPVSASPWRVGHTFERSFKTSVKGLLRARRGSSRFPIRALYGASVPKEIVKDQTAHNFEASAGPLVSAAVIKRLGRLLP